MASLRVTVLSLFSLLVFLFPSFALAANYTPALVSPADGASSIPVDSSPFSWITSDAPDKYEIEWSLDSDFGLGDRLFKYELNGTEYSCSGLPGLTEIFWRVVSVKNDVRYPSSTRSCVTAKDNEGFTTTRIKYDDFSTWDTSFWSITGNTSMLTYSSGYKCIQGYFWNYSGEGFLNCRVNIPKGGGAVKFKWSHTNIYYTSYPEDAIYVQWSSDGTTWDTVLELKGQPFHSGQTSVTAPGPWAESEAILPEEAGGKNIYFRFRFYCGYGPNAYIDDVEFLNRRQDRNLAVLSEYGDPEPSGVTTFIAGDTIDATVEEHAFAPGETAKRYQCMGWTGTGSVPVTGTGTHCPFTIFRTSTITWQWEVEYRIVIMSTNGYGSPEPAGTQYFLKNTLQTFRITAVQDIGLPDERFYFMNWTGTGCCSGSGFQTTIQFNVNSSGTLVWTFKRQFTMDVESPYVGSGYSPQLGRTWHFENAIVLATCPDFIDLGGGQGRVYAGYTSASMVPEGQIRPIIVQVREPMTLTWLWQEAHLLSAISQFGEMSGTVPGWYTTGTQVSLGVSAVSTTEDPLIRWRCTGWTSTGALASGEGNLTPSFYLTAPTNIMWDWVREYYCAFSTNAGGTLPTSGWFAANSIFDITVVAPFDTNDTRYFFVGWNGFGRGAYTGVLPTGTITIREPLVHEATWRIEHRLTIVRVNGGLQTDPSGWYLEGSTVPVTATPPMAGDGERWRPDWTGTGNGSATIARSHNSPATIAITVYGPIVERIEWFMQFALTIENPDGEGFCVPPAGTYWYFGGENAYGYASQAFGTRASTGYNAVGSISGSSLPWFSFEMNAKTVLTWLWGDRPAMPANNWSGPSVISASESEGIQMVRVNGQPVIYYINPADDSIYRSVLEDNTWSTEMVFSGLGEITDLSVSVSGATVNIICTRTTDGGMVYLTDGLDGKADLPVIQPPVTSSRRARVVSSEGILWVSWFNMSDASLNVAHFDGIVWTNTVLDSSDGAGFFNAIAIPPYTENPIIAFARGGGAKGLYLATFDGTDWTVQTVISQFAGFFCDLALDGGGVPYISFQSLNSAETTELHCAWFDGQTWVDDIVDRIGPTGYDTSITVDEDGRPHIAYTNNNDLMYARLGNGAWEVRKIASGSVNGPTSILVFDSIPAVAFRMDGKLSYVDASGQATSGGGGGTIPTPTSGGGGGCFVATSAFGSLACESVEDLTQLRDSVMGRSSVASALVVLYYAASPAVAQGISTSPTVRALTRQLLR